MQAANSPSATVNNENIQFPISINNMRYFEDTTGQIVDITSSCKTVTGYSQEEFLSNAELKVEIILKEDLKIWEEYHNSKEKVDSEIIEYRINNKDGRIIWIEHSSIKVFDKDGSFLGTSCSNRDITKIKTKVVNLKSNSSVSFLWKNGENWSLEFVSENVEDLFNYTADDFMRGEIKYSDLIHSDDIERVTQEVITQSNSDAKSFYHKPYRIITKDKKAAGSQFGRFNSRRGYCFLIYKNGI